MDDKNQTTVTKFLFVGLTDHLPQKIFLFWVFLCIYLVTWWGDLGMTTLIWMDSRLQTPMYFFHFFLSHLSLVDVCSSSVAPKMLCDTFLERKVISFMGCAVQMWFFGQFVGTKFFLLTSMVYDRYIAICNPPLYTAIMSQWVCVQLVVGPYAVGILSAVTHETFTFRLPFCGPNVVNHFFCDILPLFSLACTDTYNSKLVLFIMAGLIGILSALVILISYTHILKTILNIQSAKGRRKAFSTCSSRLSAVGILHGTLFFIYIQPNSHSSQDINKAVSALHTTLIPMLNPLIYSLRNVDVKDAFRKNFLRRR